MTGLRAEVRAHFTGTSTCTHLNDTPRALEDVPHLWGPAADQPDDGHRAPLKSTEPSGT
ncbi:DUF2889 domain-containing protein [Peterkaempfera bronchialis]|uniref:DUF2889 domain-containing protein n=1 Tax=Peterkaempfera bronchialis TaxID=2126346 RepID=A0A345SR24_9ACTN|nr:DUF2889 domain-containing protein [Peterkaempfera bronchialis]